VLNFRSDDAKPVPTALIVESNQAFKLMKSLIQKDIF
jgi:hypothetical protein